MIFDIEPIIEHVALKQIQEEVFTEAIEFGKAMGSPGLLFLSYVDEDSNVLISDIPEFTINESGKFIFFVNEAQNYQNGVPSYFIHDLKQYERKRGQFRYIFISSQTGSYSSRMKISKYGQHVNRDWSSYFGIYIKSEPDTDNINGINWGYDGKKETIDMSNSELDSYKHLYLRNYDLMILANNPMFNPHCSQALLRHENYRHEGKIVVLSRQTGLARIYYPEHTLFKVESIDGKVAEKHKRSEKYNDGLFM